MALDAPQAFGMEIDEASATPVTASACTGEEPQSVDMYRLKPGSDLSGLSAAAFAFNPAQALGATAFPAKGKLDLGNLSFDGAGGSRARSTRAARPRPPLPRRARHAHSRRRGRRRHVAGHRARPCRLWHSTSRPAP